MADTLSTVAAKDWTWVVHNALSLAITGALVIASVWGVETLIEKRDAAQAQKFEQILQATQQQTADLKVQIAQSEAAWERQESQLLASNAQLAQAAAKRDQQTQQQVKNDATLSTQDAASRLAAQTGASAGQIVANSNGLSIDLPISRTIIASLDNYAGAIGDVSATKAQLANETQIATDAQSDLAANKKLNADLNSQLSDQQNVCNAQTAKLKAQARISKLKWFGIGFMAGFVTGHVW